MNPYVVLVSVVLAAAAWFGGDHAGHERGINQQKVADQARFDEINTGLAEQKAEANAAYRAFQAHNVALLVERDQLKTTLEDEHETNRRATTALRDQYSAVGLRFRTGESSGLGSCGRSTADAGIDSTNPAGPAVVQIPDALTADLRRLAFDAEELADSYRECFGYAQKVR